MAEVLRNNRQSARFAFFANMQRMQDPLHEPRPRNAEVERLVEAVGWTQAQIAEYLTRRTGRTFFHYHVSRMIAGTRKVAHDEMDALRELIEARPELAPARESAEPASTPPGMVPLLGFANAAGARTHNNEDNTVGAVPIHPAQHNSRGAYAFYTFGDSTSPRLAHGDVGYAIRHKPPVPGQLCVITQRDGEVLVKFFDRMDDRTLYVYESQPKRREIPIARAQVLRVDAVVGSTFNT
jgi:hypothetical protein